MVHDFLLLLFCLMVYFATLVLFYTQEQLRLQEAKKIAGNSATGEELTISDFKAKKLYSIL